MEYMYNNGSASRPSSSSRASFIKSHSPKTEFPRRLDPVNKKTNFGEAKQWCRRARLIRDV